MCFGLLIPRYVAVGNSKHAIYSCRMQGLVTLNRGDRLAQHKIYFARDDNQDQQYKELIDIVNYVKPTA